MSEGTRAVAPANTSRRNRGWFPRLALAGLIATAGLLAAPGIASAYPLIGS